MSLLPDSRGGEEEEEEEEEVIKKLKKRTQTRGVRAFARTPNNKH